MLDKGHRRCPSGISRRNFKASLGTDKKGYFVNILIYDIEGRLVKRLTINELLSSEGQIKWDGETEEKLVAPVGTYIIYIELIDPDGSVKKIKKLCVLADQF